MASVPVKLSRSQRNTPRGRRFVLFALLLACFAAALPMAQAQRWHASAMRHPARVQPQPLEDLVHMSWTRRDGAPTDIAALAQTKDGYLWIGSRLGLFRFDGLHFASYPFTSADPELPSSDIAALAAAPDGGLWIGYRMGGITYLRGATKVDYDKRSGLVSESTEQLIARADGSVWATADGRLMHLVGSHWENYSAKHGLASDGLYSMFWDRDGNLWTGYKGGMAELKAGSGSFQITDLPKAQINQFAQLPGGALWVSDAWKRVRPLSDTSADGVRIPGVPVMLVDREGSIWLAQDFGGLIRVRKPGQPDRSVDAYSVADGLTDGQTRAIVEDKQGAIWVGTARGLDRFQHSALQQFRGTTFDYYPALAADGEGGVWFNDMDKPLMRLAHDQLSLRGTQSHGSSSLYQDSDNGIWLIDPITHQLFRYAQDGGAAQTIPAPPIARDVETWCIGKDASGAMLACVEGHGLWRYTDAWRRVSAPNLPEDAPLSLVRGVQGRVWLGYAHDQIVLNDVSGYHVFGRKQGLAVNSVLTFYDAHGLTLAGGSDGLAVLKDGRFYPLLLRTNGLLRGISGIVQDRSGDVWLNAAAGIIRLPASQWKEAVRDPQHRMDFQFLNERDGLIGTPSQGKPAPSAVADSAGKLWFATSGHLFSLNPASIREDQEPPNVLMQSVLVNGSVVDYREGRPIKTDAHHLKTLELDYIGVDLNAPDRVTYRYMLEPQDREWQEVGSRRQAYYTNLSPGKYIFRLQASSGSGKWTALQGNLQLEVKPAIHQTKLFILLCFAALGASLWILHRLRLQYMTAKVRERLEERAGERVRIARDLHDTLLQGVQGLVLRFHFATEQLPDDEPARAVLRNALIRADEVISEGREKVRELRAEPLLARDLKECLQEAVATLQPESSARITFVTSGDVRLLQPLIQDELYNIGREALTNAVRHARAQLIQLELRFEDERLVLRCTDDGIGVETEVAQAGARNGHWGIIGMRERAMRVGCRLEIRDVATGGTEVRVTVTDRQAYAKTPHPFEYRLLTLRAKDRT